MDELREHISKIMPSLPKNRQFYGKSVTQKVLSIYNLPLHKTFVTKDAVILNIRIPLIGDTFECEKFFPIPIKNKVLSTDIEFIIWNETTNQHILLSNENKNKNCIKYEDVKMCRFDVIQKTAENNNCEFDATLSNKNNSDCKWEKIEKSEDFIKIHENQWIFWSSNDMNKVKLSCQSGMHTVILEEKTLITLNESCTIETNRSIVHEQFTRASHINVKKAWRTVEITAAAVPMPDMKELNESAKILEFGLSLLRKHEVNTLLLYMVIFVLIVLLMHYHKNVVAEEKIVHPKL